MQRTAQACLAALVVLGAAAIPAAATVDGGHHRACHRATAHHRCPTGHGVSRKNGGATGRAPTPGGPALPNPAAPPAPPHFPQPHPTPGGQAPAGHDPGPAS
jgi:hypothetical protein